MKSSGYMWKLFEDIKNELKKGEDALKNDLDRDEKEREDVAQFMQKAVIAGSKIVKDNTVVSPAEGEVVAVNDTPEGIEIRLDNGDCVYVNFMLFRTSCTVEARPGQNVNKGDVLVRFERSMSGASVYLCTAAMEDKYSGDVMNEIEEELEED